MEASMSALRLQSSISTSTSAPASSPHPKAGRSSFTGQQVESNSSAGSRQEFVAPPSLKLSSRRRLPSKTRCLYSPLVESYESSKVQPYTIQRDGTDGAPMVVSPSSISFLKPTVIEKRSLQDATQQEIPHRDSDEKGSATDETSPALQDPIAAAHGDSSLLASGSDVSRPNEARRSARYQPQTMSLTHSFRSAANQGVCCAIGVAGRPVANATKIGGPTGLMMGLAVAGLGIATAIHKAAETQPQQKLCTRCGGYGVECCDVCGGDGKISWEGKVHRTNPCPRCFGSRLKKCPRCDGCRSKKDSTPVLQMIKASPKPKMK